jgi:hypothetical protein
MSAISFATRARVSLGFAAVSIAVAGLAQAAETAHAPVFTGTPPASTISIGKAYSFAPTATDADGSKLTFSIVNKPSWIAFSTTTGAMTGTPSVKGTTTGIIISVTDGTFTKSLPAFSLTVKDAVATTSTPVVTNNAPTITGAPVVKAPYGKAYNFTPKASDAENDTLTFSIQNKPSWVAFNTTTGALTGTPWVKGTYTYANVIVSVSDGKTTTALPAFNITVAPVATGNAQLSWTAPTETETGEALGDLAGYRVVYGPSPDKMTQNLELPSASLTSVSIEDLSSGTYYFAVKAYTKTGVESALSEVVYKQIL